MKAEETKSIIEVRAFLECLHALTPDQQESVQQGALEIEKAYTTAPALRTDEQNALVAAHEAWKAAHETTKD
jgi:hypothetical protein